MLVLTTRLNSSRSRWQSTEAYVATNDRACIHPYAAHAAPMPSTVYSPIEIS
jgi:hypothetical protein